MISPKVRGVYLIQGIMQPTCVQNESLAESIRHAACGDPDAGILTSGAADCMATDPCYSQRALGSCTTGLQISTDYLLSCDHATVASRSCYTDALMLCRGMEFGGTAVDLAAGYRASSCSLMLNDIRSGSNQYAEAVLFALPILLLYGITGITLRGEDISII